MVYSFRDALKALDGGDAHLLRHILGSRPGLARARAAGDEGDPQHYTGYFQRSTLLHHLAGNPSRGAMPRNAAELARILLDAGAEVDAVCGTLPGQRSWEGETTLALAMNSPALAESGQAPALIDVLLEHGAKRGLDDGYLLWRALFHCVESTSLRQIAAHLRARGAAVDLALAAGLGETETVLAMLGPAGVPKAHSASFAPARRQESKLPTGAEIVTEALVLAAANGRDAVASALLESGAPVDGWSAFGPVTVTALHAAAWAGWSGTCEFLLGQGATPTLRDPKHDQTPLGWAIRKKRVATAEVFLRRPDTLDVWDALEHGFEERALELTARLSPDSTMGASMPGILLRSAARLGRQNVVRFLLARGANAALPDERGQTAADVALVNGHLDLSQLLRQAQPQVSTSSCSGAGAP